MTGKTNAPIYELVSHLITNAPALAARWNSPVVEADDCYRVHKRYVTSALLDLDQQTSHDLEFVINELFHKQAHFDAQTLWITIFKQK